MFDETADAPARPLMQDPAFAQALRLCGQHPITLPCGLILLRRRFAGLSLLMLPRAAPPKDLWSQLRALSLHRLPLLLSPELHSPLPRALRLARPRLRAVLDLRGSQAARRVGLHPKWRNQLSRAERLGTKVTFAPLPPDPNHPVLRQEQTQSTTRGYANWPSALTAAFAAASPNQTHLLCAMSKGRPLAHMLFLSHGTAATYHIGHITEAGKRVGAHNLLLWQAMGHLSRLGCRSVDLGLLHAATPDLNRFKCRSGAQPLETGGTYLVWTPLARS